MILPLHDDNPHQSFPAVTLGLVAINTLAWLWFWLLPGVRQEEMVYRHGFVPARLAQLESERFLLVQVGHGDPRAPMRQVALPPSRVEIFATLMTCLFLHGGWLHLLGNMWFLWLFGNNVEDRLGHFTYLVFYLLTGLVASLCHWVNDPVSAVPVVGASGAVAGVLGAYAITFPGARVRSLVFLVVFFTTVDLPALLVLGFWFLGQVVEATLLTSDGFNGGVAWWAHIGGFVAGLSTMPWLDRERRRASGLPTKDYDDDDSFRWP